jgi:hypothetical protein
MPKLDVEFEADVGGHPKQELVWDDSHRFIDIMAGRRGGKDWIGVRKALRKIYEDDLPPVLRVHSNYSILRNLPRLLYWFLAPDYSIVRIVIQKLFEFIPEELIQYDGTRSTQPYIWLYPEIKIEFKSGERPERLVGAGLDGIYVSETARLKPTLWNDSLRPTLSDKQGWAIFTTTPLWRNWYFEDIRRLAEPGKDHDDEWVGYTWHTVDNDRVPGLLEEVEKARKTMPHKYFIRNYEACPDAFFGQIYDEFNYDIHTADFEIDLSRYKIIIAGQDWGYVHHGGFVVIGINNDDCVDVLEENSEAGIPVGHIDLPDEDSWVNRARDASPRYGNIEMFYCGHDRPENIEAMNRAFGDVVTATTAITNVYDGIQTIATLMHIDRNGHTRLRIHRTNCPRLCKYLPAYHWKASKEGVHKEEPDKVDDDECDMLRYAVHSGMKAWRGWKGND